MRTIKSETVALIASQIAVLGLIGNDAERLARRLVEGKQGRSCEAYANILHNSCRDTINDEQDCLLRVTGEDFVIYGPRGFIVYNHVESTLEIARAYRHGQSFDSITGIYREEPLSLQDLQVSEQHTQISAVA